MRLRHFAPIVLLLAAAKLSGVSSAADLTPKLVWLTDMDQALDEAQRLHRPVVVHFHTKSCPPCRKMERELLDTPAVLSQLDAGFIAVKVDLDLKAGNGKWQKKYEVESMPTDLILDEQGVVLVRSEGYLGDRQKYLSSLKRIDARYAADGKRLARAKPAPPITEVKASDPPATGTPTELANSGNPRIKLVPDPTEPKLLTADAIEEDPADADPGEVSPPGTLLAMDGYCPVTLRSTRTWKTGSRQFAAEHDGQTFLFLAAANRDEFRVNPSRYAPRLLGCDPVVLAENDLALRGNTKFGAYYEGELYLFESAETRTRFKKDPGRYARIKHVLKPEDVKTARKVASTSEK
ncbi:MAG: thioredoxin family protein [Planctomycetales bacterium]